MTTLARALHCHDIAARRGEPVDMVSPADFDLSFTACLAAADLPPGALAYCADFAAERLLFTVLPEAAIPAALDAPFLYSAQLQMADTVITVPFEQMEALLGAGANWAPLLIFSPGRTGSTLLTRLLNAVGRRGASEPDLPTQLCGLEDEGQARLTPALEQAVLRAGMASLARHLGPVPFVKLRSQCNARPDLLLAALPQARPVFLFRGILPWALSRHRAFAEPPDMVADILRKAVVAVDCLTRAGHAPKIIWFEDLLKDAPALLADLLQDRRLLRAAMRPLVAAVMALDSQAGTSLARDMVRTRDIDAAFLAGFAAEWDLRRPTQALGARLGGLLSQLESGDGLSQRP